MCVRGHSGGIYEKCEFLNCSKNEGVTDMVSHGNLEIKLCWSHDVSEKEVNDFIEIMNDVFGHTMNKSLFEKKYLNNIYGSSVLVFAYKDDKCVGVRAFWRNDIEDIKSFQPCDTAVLKEARGEGIFTKMTLKALEEIGDDVLIYNFPNDNSLPGYLKLGWQVYTRKRYKIFNPFRDFSLIDKIPEDYLKWMLSDINSDFEKKYCYTKVLGRDLLIKQKRGDMYVIIGEIIGGNFRNLSKIKKRLLLTFSEKGYVGRGIVIVSKNMRSKVHIPIYKMDTLF